MPLPPAARSRRPGDAVRARLWAGALAALVFALSATLALGPLDWSRREIAATAPLRAAVVGAPLRVLEWVTTLHSEGVVLALAVLLALGFRRRGMVHLFRLTLLALPLGMLVNLALKHLVMRERPAVLLGVVDYSRTYSFPSGHVFGATVLYLLLAAWLLPMLRIAWQRVALAACMAAMVALVCLSRVSLGAHFPSDTTGSVAVGVLWWLVALALTDRLETRRS